jgi:hypothetical protein
LICGVSFALQVAGTLSKSLHCRFARVLTQSEFIHKPVRNIHNNFPLYWIVPSDAPVRHDYGEGMARQPPASAVDASKQGRRRLLGGAAAVITGLSLSHLAHGVELITQPAHEWESWTLAVGINIGMVATEIATLTAGERVRRETRWYSGSMIAGTLLLSATINAFGFAAKATTLPFQAAGVVFGVAVPAAIYVIMRQAAAHYLDAHKRS